MTKFIRTAIALMFGFLALTAYAKDESSGTVRAKLICGEHSANPEKRRAFQRDLSFVRSGPQLTASYKTDSHGGTENHFTGIVSPTGNILVTGVGEGKEGGKWIYQFSGVSNPNGDTELKGRLENTSGAVGGRDCSLIFIKPRAL